MSALVNFVYLADSGFGAPPREESVAATPYEDPELVKKQLLDAGYKTATFVRKEWEKWAWPGGYPIYYVCEDGGVLCADCANNNIDLTTDPDAERDWKIVAGDINYEDDSLSCDNCYGHIESAYGCDEC